MLKLAQILEFSVIAEGVETESHVETLRQIGCRCAQGYYFAKPLPVEEWINYLHSIEQSAIVSDTFS